MRSLPKGRLLLADLTGAAAPGMGRGAMAQAGAGHNDTIKRAAQHGETIDARL
jgi:hypothetical protein